MKKNVHSAGAWFTLIALLCVFFSFFSIPGLAAENNGNEAVDSGANTYTINYLRDDESQSQWDLWIWEEGKNGTAYPFTSVTDEGFAQTVLSFESKQISLIPRPGDWSMQDITRTITIPEGENQVEVWIVEGIEKVFYSQDELESPDKVESRFIEFTYVRENNDYEGWNLWVWGSGAKNDQIDFEEVTSEGAVARIEVGPETERIGFTIRKGDDWAVKDPYGKDRYITIENADYTKVVVASGVEEFKQTPFISGPELDRGTATFYYRDKDLFRQGEMDSIDQVQLKIDGQLFGMEYYSSEERYAYSLESIPEGQTAYTFLVTIDGVTKEVTDPYHTENGQSLITYQKPDLSIDASVNPAKVTYNENAVLSVDIESDIPVEFKEMYVDLSVLGGPKKMEIDPQLNKQTIAVKDTVTAGVKQLPITMVDKYGNYYESTVEIVVETRTAVGELDFDWDEAQIYFMLTDRFHDGDPTNNDPNGMAYDINHPETYHGGDFQGIIEKLDYLDDLGINTIWITPIVDNIEWDLRHDKVGSQFAYHGYWAKDFTTLDEHLGDMETFQTLIDQAHDRGIKIMVDVVLNHTGYGLKENDPLIGKGILNFPNENDRNRFDSMLREGGTDTVKGELAGLPDFITEDQEVRNQIIEWQTDWLEKARTDRGDTIDYFRVDTVKHIEHTTWKAFKNRLTEIEPGFKMIGEYFGGHVDEHGNSLNSGEMDSILDFEFKHTAEEFINGNITETEKYLQYRNEKLNNTATLGQFLSSHDEDGFLIAHAESDIGKAMVAAALQITAKGQPVIYYGEELGLSGKNAGDMDTEEFSENRYDFPWKEVEGNPVHQHYTKLLNIRAEHSKLFSKGSRSLLTGDDESGYSIFERSYKEESLLIGLNTEKNAKQVTVSVPYPANSVLVDLYSGKKYKVDKKKEVTIEMPSRDDGGTFILEKLSQSKEKNEKAKGFS